MQNFYAIEIEATLQRSERERAAEADALAAQARPGPGRMRRPRLPRLILTRLRALQVQWRRPPALWPISEGGDMPTP